MPCFGTDSLSFVVLIIRNAIALHFSLINTFMFLNQSYKKLIYMQTGQLAKAP